MAAVGHRDVGAGHEHRAVGGEPRIEPVLLAAEPRRRDVRVVLRAGGTGEQRPNVQIVAVDEQLRHRNRHRLDLVLLARQRRDQLRVVQARGGRGQAHLHQCHRVGRQLQERGVAAVDRVSDAVREVDAVPQALLPVVDPVERLTARADVAALVHRREVPDLRGQRLDPLQLGRQLAQQRVHLRRVAGALGLELTGELALLLGALDDRVHLLGRSADHGLGRRGVDAHFQIRVVREHRLDLVGRVLHQGHQPDVLAEQHRLALTHQMGAGGDRAGGVFKRQATGEVRRRGLAQRLPDHRGGLGPVVLQQLAEGHLDREDDDLRGLDAVVLGVVEDQLDDRVTALILNQRVHRVDPVGEHLVAQVQALGHLAVLSAESGEHPYRPVGHRPVGGEHVRPLLAFGHRAKALDRLVVVVGQHHSAGPAVVTPRQRPADRLQRRRPAFRTVDPVGQFGGGRLLARRQERRNRQRHKGHRRFVGLELVERNLLEPQRLIGQPGQCVLLCGGFGQIVIDELAVLVEPHPAHVGRVLVVFGRLLLDLGFGLRFLLDDVAGQHLAQHHVRVRAAEAEPGHARDRVAAVAGPLGDGVGDLQPHGLEVDVRIGSGVVDRRGQLVVLQRQRHLDQAGRTGGRLEVTDVGLDGAQQGRIVGRAAPADDAAQRLRLDRVAEDRACAVRLDVVDEAGVDPGVLVRAPQHGGLRIGVRGEQAVGAAVVVDRAACDHGDDLVAVSAGVGHALEHQHAAALGAGVAVGVGRERLDPPVVGQHPADLVETDRHHRRDQCVDAARQDDVGLTVAQRLHALVHRHQRARAGGIQRHRRSAEVEEIRHPVGDDRARGAGDRVRMRDRRVGHRQEAVVVGGGADVDTDAVAAQARRRDPGVLQCLPRQLERHPLLRVEVVGLHLRQREELRVETLDVAQVPAAGAGLRDQLGQPRLLEEFRPAALGQVDDRVAPGEQRLPHLVGRVHVAGEPGGQPDDRDVVDVTGA